MQPIHGLQLPQISGKEETSAVSSAEKNFSDMLTGLVKEVDQQQKTADKTVQQVHAGGAKNLHDAMIAMEQADISIRFMVQVRNKALEAYQEIMRMQV